MPNHEVNFKPRVVICKEQEDGWACTYAQQLNDKPNFQKPNFDKPNFNKPNFEHGPHGVPNTTDTPISKGKDGALAKGGCLDIPPLDEKHGHKLTKKEEAMMLDKKLHKDIDVHGGGKLGKHDKVDQSKCGHDDDTVHTHVRGLSPKDREAIEAKLRAMKEREQIHIKGGCDPNGAPIDQYMRHSNGTSRTFTYDSPDSIYRRSQSAGAVAGEITSDGGPGGSGTTASARRIYRPTNTLQ